MEAMKMENNITAEADGTVKAIVAQVGQSVNQGDVLVELEGVAAPAAAAPAPKAAPAAPKAAPSAAAAPAAKPAAGAKTVNAPLPGTITAVKVSTGQAVKKGEVLVVMEAMKMANDITAECDGTVKNIFVQQGASVNVGDALVEIA
ncbi:MAG: biotin/lipoyl-binding protein [Bacteroidaceae bacterium]|nr:biotin/lipoyl-binding protein [Bacteroidaceae bacterium]